MYYTATNPPPSSHMIIGLNFLLPNFESNIKKSGNAIQFNFSTLKSVLRGNSAWQFKMFFNHEKCHFFNFNTDSRISLFARAHYLRSKVNIKAVELHFRISKMLYWLEKITILLNLRSISFIGSGSFFLIKQY